MFTEEDLLPLSALQHLIFCERQAVLIHVEQQWADNPLTVEGTHLHRRADETGPRVETRGDLRTVRRLTLQSLRLGLVARVFVIAKIANARHVLLRGAREAGGPPEAPLREAAERLSALTLLLEHEEEVDSIRGFEGEAARVYFSVFSHLIGGEEAFRFERRTRRPPMDRINALLSFVYTLLVHDVAAALESVGLDPAVGFLHRDRPGRPSLALDLMEEFRPFFADRLVLSLVNRRQVQPKGFVVQESGAVWMDDDTRKTVLTAYQKRKQESIRHPFLEEDTTVGLLFHLQARLLAAHLRDDLDGYPPMIWR